MSHSATHKQCTCLLCVFLSCLWWESGVTHREERSDLQPIMAPQLPAWSELQLEYTGKPRRCDHNQVDAHKQSLTVVIKWVVTWLFLLPWYITRCPTSICPVHGVCPVLVHLCFSSVQARNSAFHEHQLVTATFTLLETPTAFIYILNCMTVWYLQTKSQCKGFSN